MLRTRGDDGERKEENELADVVDECGGWSPSGKPCAMNMFQEEAIFGKSLCSQNIWVTLNGLEEFSSVYVSSDSYGIGRTINADAKNEVLVRFMMWDTTWPDIDEDCLEHSSPDSSLNASINGAQRTNRS